MENMNELKKALKLDQKIALYIPGTVAVDQKIDNSAEVRAAAAAFSEMFGGASAQQIKGYWTSASGEVVEEETTIVYSNCTEEQKAQHLKKVLAMAEGMKIRMNQEAVSLEIDGTLYII